jgi:hypothetical protein
MPIAVDAAPTLAPLLVAQGAAYMSSAATEGKSVFSPRMRVVILTSAALSSIIAGAFISAAAMTNFPQAVFFGSVLFVALEVGTWWTLRRATSQNGDITPMEYRSTLALSVTAIALTAYRFPTALAWAFASVLASIVLSLLRRGTLRVPLGNMLPTIASMTILEVAMRQSLGLFLRLIAATLGQSEVERDVVLLVFQESVMFGNRFVASWHGIVAALQLVARVILHLQILGHL